MASRQVKRSMIKSKTSRSVNDVNAQRGWEGAGRPQTFRKMLKGMTLGYGS